MDWLNQFIPPNYQVAWMTETLGGEHQKQNLDDLLKKEWKFVTWGAPESKDRFMKIGEQENDRIVFSLDGCIRNGNSILMIKPKEAWQADQALHLKKGDEMYAQALTGIQEGLSLMIEQLLSCKGEKVEMIIFKNEVELS
jgi:hypothetical protein